MPHRVRAELTGSPHELARVVLALHRRGLHPRFVTYRVGGGGALLVLSAGDATEAERARRALDSLVSTTAVTVTAPGLFR
jgi:hypothetical protein